MRPKSPGNLQNAESSYLVRHTRPTSRLYIKIQLTLCTTTRRTRTIFNYPGKYWNFYWADPKRFARSIGVQVELPTVGLYRKAFILEVSVGGREKAGLNSKGREKVSLNSVRSSWSRLLIPIRAPSVCSGRIFRYRTAKSIRQNHIDLIAIGCGVGNVQ